VSRRGARILLNLLLAWPLGAGGRSAIAASDVSYKYDGVYIGEALPAPTMGSPSCAAFEVREFEITKGILRTPVPSQGQSVSGFNTEEGYVQATLAHLGHQKISDGCAAGGRYHRRRLYCCGRKLLLGAPAASPLRGGRKARWSQSTKLAGVAWVFELPPKLIRLSDKPVGITKFKKIVVPVVAAAHPCGVFDRAPELLSP
jgi:hypothetical protein